MPEPFRLGGVEVPPGERRTIELPVGRRVTRAELVLPVEVVNGNRPGPRLFVCAAVHGATHTRSVDLSAAVLERARDNFALNGLDPDAHAFDAEDAFKVLDRLRRRGERFDRIVVDPPSFASNAAAVPRALAAYARLTHLGLAVVRPGGTLIQASCSSRVGADEFASTVLQAASTARADVHETRRTGHAVDHPISFEHGSYLKAIYLKVRA